MINTQTGLEKSSAAWGIREGFPGENGESLIVTFMGPRHFRLPGALPPSKHRYRLKCFYDCGGMLIKNRYNSVWIHNYIYSLLSYHLFSYFKIKQGTWVVPSAEHPTL